MRIMDNRVSFISLCCVREDHMLERLADIQENKLCEPFKSERKDEYFENRDVLFQNDNSLIPGTIGVWEWTARLRDKDPQKDYIESYQLKDYVPVRVVPFLKGSLKTIVSQLKNGEIYIDEYYCDTFFCCKDQQDKWLGVLCHTDEFEFRDGRVWLLEKVYYLPEYVVSAKNVYMNNDLNLKFLKNLQIGLPLRYYQVKSNDEIIREIILERTTWPSFKEIMGLTKADWRNCKRFIESITTESLYQEASEKLRCSFNEAKQSVDDFVKYADKRIEAGDIDQDIIAQIAVHHEDLRKLCEQKVEKEWNKEHQKEIEEAENEIAEKKENMELELKKTQEQLTSAKKEYENILKELTANKEILVGLQTDIERCEALGNDTLAAVQKKISDAQKDMAGFIADLSVFLPQEKMSLHSNEKYCSWQYIEGAKERYKNIDITLSEDWCDEFDAIYSNLYHVFKIDLELCELVTAFLYAVQINHAPMLIAGPAGVDIAEILSASIYANGVGRVILGEKSDLHIAEKIKTGSDPIAVVQNMFGKGWSDDLPQIFLKSEKQIIWTHPYMEDLLIEPKGLYNYMIPILSECFIDSLPACNIDPNERSKDFRPYVSEKEKPLSIPALKKLGLSKFLLKRLTLILSDAKNIMNKPAKDKDLEFLFGVLPMCVLTGRLDIMKEVMETEEGLSRSVRAEAERYLEKE